MITTDTKSKIEAIVNVFETGSITGGYGTVSIYKDGKANSRQITYGRSQTTEQGNLHTLISMYVSNQGQFANEFSPYLSSIGKTSLVDDSLFRSLLRKAGNDPIMRQTQDYFFDIIYYTPALHFFDGYKFVLPLSMLVIYDSYIHSGSVPGFLRQGFKEMPPSMGGSEKKWVTAYTQTRQDWLKTNSKQILRKTVYRTGCFLEQIKNDNWDLMLPVNANGIMVP